MADVDQSPRRRFANGKDAKPWVRSQMARTGMYSEHAMQWCNSPSVALPKLILFWRQGEPHHRKRHKVQEIMASDLFCYDITMKLSVMFWNIWLDNQIMGKQNSVALLNELENLVNRYNPDVIGLTEVLQKKNTSAPFVTTYLQSKGYRHTHYAPASPFNDEWLIGAAVSSKLPFTLVKDIELGKDTPAEVRGYPGHTVKAICAELELGKRRAISFITAHPIHLRPNTMRDHYQHTKNLAQFIIDASSQKQPIILAGDFNEPSYIMPNSFTDRVSQRMDYATGTFRNPTWRHNTSRITPIRANLDRLFWSKQKSLKLLDFKVIDSDVSDHRPLFATYEIV